jgi:hypothetical protein
MYLMAFLASFCFVCLKAFQQLSVSGKHYKLIVPVSLMMASLEVWTVTVISKHGFGLLVLCIGLGAGLGAMLGMYIHDRFVK